MCPFSSDEEMARALSVASRLWFGVWWYVFFAGHTPRGRTDWIEGGAGTNSKAAIRGLVRSWVCHQSNQGSELSESVGSVRCCQDRKGNSRLDCCSHVISFLGFD